MPFNENQGVFRPELTIVVSNEKTGKSVITNALIDSGADVTVFPKSIFDVLGIDIEENNTESNKIYGVSGESITTLKFKTDILILKENNKPFTRVSDVLINCVYAKDTHILLGTNFFSPKFKVTLDYLNKMIMLEC